MNLKQLFVAMPAALFVLSSGVANGQPINEAGAFACVADKWDETEPEKAHKWVDYAGRCVGIPDTPDAPKYTEDCVGKYEYMPDGSWKGSGTCTFNFKGGDKLYGSFEEGSHLKITGGTGIFEGEWRRHLHLRETDGYPLGRKIQRRAGAALIYMRGPGPKWLERHGGQSGPPDETEVRPLVLDGQN